MATGERLNITVTDAALAKLKDAIAEFNRGFDRDEHNFANLSCARGIRLGVRGGGCGGFEYFLGLEGKASAERDVPFENIGGVQFVIDRLSYMYLDGIQIDFDTSLMGKGFLFNNPNTSSHCGCGRSFGV